MSHRYGRRRVEPEEISPALTMLDLGVPAWIVAKHYQVSIVFICALRVLRKMPCDPTIYFSSLSEPYQNQTRELNLERDMQSLHWFWAADVGEDFYGVDELEIFNDR